jgi:hypothetical protein
MGSKKEKSIITNFVPKISVRALQGGELMDMPLSNKSSHTHAAGPTPHQHTLHTVNT